MHSARGLTALFIEPVLHPRVYKVSGVPMIIVEEASTLNTENEAPEVPRILHRVRQSSTTSCT